MCHLMSCLSETIILYSTSLTCRHLRRYHVLQGWNEKDLLCPLFSIRITASVYCCCAAGSLSRQSKPSLQWGCGLEIVSSLLSLVSLWQEGCVCAGTPADVVQCRRPFGLSVNLLRSPPFLQTWDLEDMVGWKNGSHFTHILTLARMTYIRYKHWYATFWAVPQFMFSGFNLTTTKLFEFQNGCNKCKQTIWKFPFSSRLKK